MITSWEIYWITRLDNIRAVLVVLFCVGLLLALIRFVGSMYVWFDGIVGDEKDKRGLQGMRRGLLYLIAPFIFITLMGFTPTTREMCAIVAIPAIVNNEEVQQLPERVVQLANEWIDELRPKTKTVTVSVGDGKKAPMDSSP